MMNQHEFEEKLYYNLSLTRLVPQDHLLRQIAQNDAAPGVFALVMLPWDDLRATLRRHGVTFSLAGLTASFVRDKIAAL